jgi:anthranilate synthase component 2
MKILVFDNYDSFTYNLVHIIRELGYGEHMDIVRNDKIELEEIGVYDKILLSPGPGVPKDAGIMERLIAEYASSKSIMGVCLGHQGVPETIKVCRYHSWAVVPETVKGDLEITAIDDDGVVMALKHKNYDVRGLQFHPEAYLTEHGKLMVENWLKN